MRPGRGEEEEEERGGDGVGRAGRAGMQKRGKDGRKEEGIKRGYEEEGKDACRPLEDFLLVPMRGGDKLGYLFL